jgi:threonine dehydrogenase-like Zn-dependent dehydrogenase
MHFEYRGFNIECSAADGGAGFIGLATIYQASADGEDRKVFTSNSPSRLRKYRPTLLSHELDQDFQRGIFHSLEYGPVNFGFRTCL